MRGESPDFRAEYFRPFRCSVFHPVAGRRTDLPKVFRVFFRHDKRLH
ncbi:MAG: hypothetical protein NTU62_11305 [Spirochaetes bacterium]|nr:hypothetical protein [Spirochaetota bacterium]